MEYILIAVLAGMAGFLCLLLYYDLPPRAALYKIIGRFFELPEKLRPIEPDALYCRVRPASKELHKPILLNLETSDGSGQAVHPDVVYIPGGFGSKKWPYWMVCTPYPCGNERFENPEIFVSYDAITWFIPDGVRNPIVPPLEIATSHHSDPDILFHANMLWLIYRQTIRSKTSRENILYLIKSSDGVSWSRPIAILRDKEGAELLSPSIVHDGTSFLLWTVETHGGEFQIMRRTSQDCLVWDKAVAGSISRLEKGRHPWHIDVIKDKGRLSAALVSCTARNGGGSRIHYAHSLDEGFCWQVSDFLLEQIYEFESSLQYRGTLRRFEADSPDSYQLWYSAVSSKNISSIAYLRLVRDQNNLFPFSGS